MKKRYNKFTGTFATRYFAEQERKSNPYFNSTDIIVHVTGGYIIMKPEEYNIWKKQK